MSAIERALAGTAGSMRILLPSGQAVDLTTLPAPFTRWRGEQPTDTYNGKPSVDWLGKPLFAELAILRALEQEGWQGVWFDAYHHKFRVDLRHVAPVSLPIAIAKRYRAMRVAYAKPRGGCWDVLAWRGSDLLCLESKWLGGTKPDELRDTQKAWLEAALSIGIPLAAFVLVEWDNP